MQSLGALLPALVQSTAVRRLHGGDLERFHAYRSDPDLAVYQGWSPISLESARDFIAEMASVSALRQGDWIQLGIADTSSNALIGDVGLYLEADASAAEVGFTLRREDHGIGHAKRAVRAALSLVFAASAANLVRAVTDARNAASIRVLERANFAKSHAQDATFKGEACTELVYVYRRPDA